MCNRYVTAEQAEIERLWMTLPPQPFHCLEMFPRSKGPFLRPAPGSDRPEVVIGQWGLIPWFSKTATLAYATNNARFEELTAKASYKQPWAKGKRCIIPATEFYEPCWESGKNVWWGFRRRDGDPWGLAGLWSTWTDKATGEIHESFTMLTINADEHPLMRRMHKPDPKLSADRQDKRSVIAIERDDVEQWLHGSAAEATALAQPPGIDTIDGSPEALRKTRG